MYMKSRPSTLTMECSEWAESFAKRCLADGGSPKFHAFKPKHAPAACFLGEFTDRDGNFFYPQPVWQWHVAVELNDLMFDEVHPMGVPKATYLTFFREIELITVTEHPDLPSAVNSANEWIRPSKW
jgi:hypothetical protein